MARLKLELWESVIADCQSCLGLSPENMKAFYYLSQAQLALRLFDDATNAALKAHDLCAMTNDKSLGVVTAHVLRCKKDRWDAMEKRRIREGQQLENEVLELMTRERDESLKNEIDEAIRKEMEKEWEDKMNTMRDIFEKARATDQKKRSVPDWAIDDISFGIMIDPVVVSSDKGPFSSVFALTRCSVDKNRQIVRAGIHHGAPSSPPLRSSHQGTPEGGRAPA
jgi:STIP1 homology and U-box containing protein 1